MTAHPFSVLKPEYATLLAQMKITRLAAVDATVDRLVKYIDDGNYKPGCDATGVPQPVAAASFEREASSNFRLSPAQGDPINRPSIHVPAHRGPYPDWEAAQIDAYQIDGFDKIGAANWSWERACYEEELFNGFGYRAYGVHSPYLWGGTNIQQPGKFTSDHGFDRSTMDTQLGVVPMMLRIVQMRPAVALPFAFPGSAAPALETIPTVVAPPQAAPVGLHDALALQIALNKLGANPQLVADGNYGRNTKRAVIEFQSANGLDADGLAGPITRQKIQDTIGIMENHAKT